LSVGRVSFTRDARHWYLREIAYLADMNPAAARNLDRRMSAIREKLSAFPGIAQPGPLPGTRRFVLPPYILTLAEVRGHLVITAIRHARQSDEPSLDEGTTGS